MPAEIPPETVARFSPVRFASAGDVEDFFREEKDAHFLTWFNGVFPQAGPWKGVRLIDTPQNQIGFHQFWNRIPQVFGGPASLLQCVALMSIIANEVRGDFFPRTERMGVAGHPGMAYLFDRIPNKKRSYNTLKGNQTAFQCFNNVGYRTAHGALPLADQLARTTDTRWSGEVWPDGVPTTPDPEVTGFIAQADFMKFRGRGFIQTTGRANYLPLIQFVQAYSGANSTLDFFRRRWTNRAPARVAFQSTNEDWDALFQQTDLVVAAEAVRLHNANSGDYLALSENPEVLNGTQKGSVHYMGLRISGGEAYARLFQDRVAAVLDALVA